MAYADRLVVVNGYRRHEYDWPQIVAARLPPGAPWVTLDLADGETASVLAIQGSDGNRARIALRELKSLVAAASASSRSDALQRSRLRRSVEGVDAPGGGEVLAGGEVRRSSPERKASAWAVIGSTATARRWAPALSSAV